MRSLSKTLKNLPAERRAKIAARAQAIIERQSLRQLREAFGKTQADVAQGMGMAQNNVARMEKKGDMLVSTVDRYVRSAGGRLRIVAEMPTGRLVELKLGSDGRMRTKGNFGVTDGEETEATKMVPRHRTARRDQAELDEVGHAE